MFASFRGDIRRRALSLGIAALFLPAAPALAEAKKPAAAAAAITPLPFTALPGRSQCQAISGYKNSQGGLRTFLLRPEWLAAEKVKVANDAAYAKILRTAAEKALKNGPYSVVDKLKTPASGDKHDYYSIGPYWWPTQGKPNGEPYSRRDGSVNPESRGPEFDKDRLFKFGEDVRILALAYHHLGDKRYAEHAAKLLRAWFLASETRMNPNLNHGQAVPGINTGRGEGIIEMIAIAPIIDSIGLIENSGALSQAELDGLEAWFGAFVKWMATSPIGKEERAKKNNHGIYYDYFISHFALFARLEPVAHKMVSDFPSRRIAIQIAPDGSFPDELARTRSYHYSFFALEAAVKLAGVGECVGLNLWSAKTDDGRSLAKAFDYLAPYQSDIGKWPHPESALGDASKEKALRRIAMEQMRLMAWGTGDQKYEMLASQHDLGIEPNKEYWLPAYVVKQ